MAARCKRFASFLRSVWFLNGGGSSEGPSQFCIRGLHRSINSTSVSSPLVDVNVHVYPSLVPREDNQPTRGLHFAAPVHKDVVLDEENPFYDKYSDKLDKMKGCVDGVAHNITLPVNSSGLVSTRLELRSRLPGCERRAGRLHLYLLFDPPIATCTHHRL